ncbi:MAG: YkgJ family cysteine cluster protein [Bacteroidota bacterium]
MEFELKSFRQKALARKKTNKKFLNSLKKESPKKLDQLFRYYHEEVFSDFSCLDCANCCKSLGPKFLPQDIDRIAAHLRMSTASFIETYLRIDEDQDYVLQKVPCAFLEDDNRCGIYEVRPKACRTYPHTDSRGMQGKLGLTQKNTLTCPAVLEIVERMQVED